MDIDGIKVSNLEELKRAVKHLKKLGLANTPEEKIDGLKPFERPLILIPDITGGDKAWKTQSHLLGSNIISIEMLENMEWVSMSTKEEQVSKFRGEIKRMLIDFSKEEVQQMLDETDESSEK